MKCKFCENKTEPGSTVCEDCCRDAAETTEWIDKRPTMKMKPTPGPVEFAKHRRVVEEIFDPFRTICDLTDSEFPVDAEDRHGEFIADAFNVRHETGLSPRELLEQRDNLLEWLDTLTLVVGLTPIAGNKEALQEAMDGARAAIAATKPEAVKGGEG